MSCYCGEQESCTTVQTINRPDALARFVQECGRKFEINPNRGMPVEGGEEGELEPSVIPMVPEPDPALAAAQARIAELEAIIAGDEPKPASTKASASSTSK